MGVEKPPRSLANRRTGELPAPDMVLQALLLHLRPICWLHVWHWCSGLWLVAESTLLKNLARF